MAKTTVEMLDDGEISRRVNILRRFRELLRAQKDRFQQYLEVLDQQKDMIEEGSAEDMAAHVELEEKIVADIFFIQKVIDPLEEMYRALYPLPKKGRKSRSKKAAEDAGGIPDLKTVLEELKSEAVSRMERNKELLSRRMTTIQAEIKTIRKNPYSRKSRSLYGEVPSPSLVDIEG
ncbi:MAG: flagellar protein FlgN [Treponema sp.]|jgi:prefoldin subunit 5|nr:flagellar protein FlgN [Treponema sp.]